MRYRITINEGRPASVGEKGEGMQGQEMTRQSIVEPPIVIKTTGLSAEAKQMFDMIARRAYEIFEAKGKVKGRELENWLEAESELFERTPINVKESSEGVTVMADVRGFAPKELEVDLEPRRVTIIGSHQSQSERTTESNSNSQTHASRLLRSLQLPIEIDTHFASARFKRGILELDVRRAKTGKGNTRTASPSGNVA
jgi:HSP20 family molecular chaperone IbpA